MFQKMAGEQEDVSLPFAQWWYMNRVGTESVEEVGTKASGSNLLPEVAVGGGDNTHVHLVLGITANTLHLPALQCPQELGLCGQGKLSHLVQEQGSFVCQLELAGAGLVCA